MQSIRRAIATFSIVAILSSFVVSTATAATFTDVPADAYYYNAIESLVDEGVIDDTTTGFNPAGNLSRALAAKFLVLGAGYTVEAHTEPTFQDVSKTHAQFDIIETAVDNLILSGYGHKPGFFGPSDTVTREQFAKMSVVAFDLPIYKPAVSTFKDVPTTHWAFEYVETAAKYGVITGYGHKPGYFGPADTIIRADGAVMTVRSQDADVTDDDDDDDDDDAPAGDLEVSLSDDSPTSIRTVPKGATGVLLTSFDFEATDGDVTIDSIKFARGGVGDTNDWNSVYVYNGDTRLRSGKSISSDTNTVEFTGLNLVVEAGETVNVLLKGDLSSGSEVAGNEEHYFGIASEDDISLLGGGSVGGSFPVLGTAVRLSTTSVSTVTLANGPSLSKPTVGQSEAKIASFKITAGANDVDFDGVTLVQNGTVSNSYLENLIVKESVTNEELGSTSALVGDKLVVMFSDSYEVKKSTNRTFDVYADLTGGKSSDTLRFYLEEGGDLLVTDKQYGFGPIVTNSFGSSAAYCLGAASNTCPAAGSFQAGAVTFADNGPTAGNVPVNTTQVSFFDFTVTSDRNVTMKDYDLIIEQTVSSVGTFDVAADVNNVAGYTVTKGTNLTVAADLAGGAAAAGTTDLDFAAGDILKINNIYFVVVSTSAAYPDSNNAANLVLTPRNSGTLANNDAITLVWDASVSSGKIKNLKLVDRDSGSVLYSTGTPTGYTLASDDFDVAATSRKLALRVDIDSTTAATNAYKFGFDFTGSNYVKDNDANEFLSSSDLVGGNIFGKVQTVTANALSISRSSVPVSKTYVKGQSGLDLIGLAMTAANAGDIKVTKITARLGAHTGATNFTSTYGDTAANTVVDKVYLYKGTEKVAGPVGMTLVGTIGSEGYYKAEFTNLSETISSGSTESYKIVVDLKNTMTAAKYLMATFDDADIIAIDSDNNSVSVDSNDTFNTVNTTTPATATPAVVMTVGTTGTLSQRQEGSPDATILVAGSSDNLFAKYKFTAVNEAFTVKKLDVVVDTDSSFSDDYSAETTTSNNISSVKIKYTDEAGAPQTATGTLSGGKASFSGISFYVPKDDSAYIEIYSTMNSISGGATSGASVRLGLNENTTTNTFEALGEASSATLTESDLSITAATDVKSMVVRKTTPTVDKASGLSSTLGDGQKDFYGFTVVADSGAAVALKRVAVNVSFTTGITVNQLQVLETKGGTTNDITSNISIRNKAGQNLKLGGSNLATDGGTATSDVIYITWDKAAANEGVVSAGSTATYAIRANVSSAASGDSISAYIPYDSVSGPATATSAGVATLRTTTTSTTPETATASPNNTRMVWRWASATTVYLDVNGSGDYESASDFLVTTLAASIGDAAYTVDQIIPGTLRYTTDDVDVGGAGDAGIYFDLNGNGDYADASDLAIAVTASVTAAPANDAVLAYTARFTTSASTTIYFDETDGGTNTVGTYAANDDTIILAANVVDPTTTPSNNDEAYTSGFNFVWSDNSSTSHTTSTTDWTNGYLVRNILSGVSHTMSK